MDLRALKYLVSLADGGSLTEAAARNFVSQPAVSIALKKLADELGITIFEVKGKRVEFTQAGGVVLGYGRRILNLVEELGREVEDFKGLKGGSLELGTIDAASLYVLPEVFALYHRKYPPVEVHLEIASTEVLLRSLSDGKVDAIIATLPVPNDGELEVYPIFSEPLVLIAPRNHPLSKLGKVKPSQLDGYPFISFHRGAVTRKIIEDTLEKAGARITVSMAIDSPEVIKRLVSTGLGMAILPARIVEGDVAGGDVVRINVDGVRIERQMGIILRKDRYIPLHLKAFVQVLSDVLGVRLPRRLKLESQN